ncbi:hypothetical protein D3C80_52350 [compost metagenome]
METILFKQDWDRYPTAIWDTQTTNTSFLEFSALLKHMGVQNHLFMLALMQPDLQGVDPYDPFLSDEMKLKIKIECTFNPWYFIREVMRVPPAAGDTPVVLQANRGNISLWWSFLNHIDYFLVQIRQTGKSLNSDGISVWYQMFGARNSRSNLFTKGDLFKEHIARLKKLRGLLPKYLVNIVKKDTDNQKEFTNMSQGNRMVVYIPQKDEEAARNLGRGLTTPHSHTDEIAFLKNVHISLGVMLAGGGAAREEAARNGLPYGNIFTTTAGELDTDEGAYAYDLMTGGAEWNDHFYDCDNSEHLYDVVRKQCRNKDAILINGTFNHKQLGKTDAWLRQKIAESRQTGDNVRRDYLNEWTSGNARNPLSKDTLRKIHASVTKPMYLEIDKQENYSIRWYIPEWEVQQGILNRELTMGMDTSNAVGRDNITGVIVDNSTLEVVGAWTVNDSNLTAFAMWVGKILVRFPKLTMVPESKSTWIGILDTLLLTLPTSKVDPAKRIYSTLVDAKDSSPEDRKRYHEYIGDRDNYRSYRKYFGFPTNSQLREIIYGPVLQEAAKKTGAVVRDAKLQSELSRLVERNGRIDHDASGHDDHVISWLLCHWFLTYGRNLEHYGITLSEVKRRIYEAEHKLSWEEQRRYDQQQNVRDEITRLGEQIGQERNTFERMKLQHRLELLLLQISDEFEMEGTMSLDQIRESSREKLNIANRSFGPGRSLDVDRPLNLNIGQRKQFRMPSQNYVIR